MLNCTASAVFVSRCALLPSLACWVQTDTHVTAKVIAAANDGNPAAAPVLRVSRPIAPLAAAAMHSARSAPATLYAQPLTSQSRISTRSAPAACAARTATAALLKKQKPIAVLLSAWCPGGRMMAAPHAASPRTTRTAASAALPAASAAQCSVCWLM
eukprot:GHRQ01034510.1.p1 GENE.GHRQ01034510.1~~GHRQ01034510.1.p1  ORF type:complete len:157 (+),score=34.96 GHRQ01034510.1:1-471(+)